MPGYDFTRDAPGIPSKWLDLPPPAAASALARSPVAIRKSTPALLHQSIHLVAPAAAWGTSFSAALVSGGISLVRKNDMDQQLGEARLHVSLRGASRYDGGVRPETLRSRGARVARRIALASVMVSAALAVTKILIGWLARSTSLTADGFESAGDVVASALVLFGLVVAALPPDENHPYGHGRFEMLTGLAVGVILAAAGGAICVRSLAHVGEPHAPPATYAIWPLVASIAVKGVMSTLKFRYGRRIQSAALVADAWNDTVDILSGFSALIALSLTLYSPARFLAADHYGGFVVGLIVVFTGARVMYDTSLQLMDTMPRQELMDQVRAVALEVPGVEGVEKLWARKTGFQYHVDLHLEVDPEISVRASHDIATQVRIRIKETLDFIADVLVHVEPAPARLDAPHKR